MAARSRRVPVDWSVQVITVGGMATPVARLLVLSCFPWSDPLGDPVPVLLGLEFFLSHRGHLSIAPTPGKGRIQLPRFWACACSSCRRFCLAILLGSEKNPAWL
jgi:hypothetical protein